MNNKKLANLIEDNWQEILVLAKNLIQCYPHYQNPEGLEKSLHFIEAYFSKNDIKHEIVEYKNSTFDNHTKYVQVEDFGPSFKDDKNRVKKIIIAQVYGKQSNKTLILNGHVDVDFVNTPEQWSSPNGWYSPKIENNLLYGRGATDMFGGLCALLMITKILKQLRHLWSGNIITTIVTDEEVGGNSTLKSLLWLDEKKLLNDQTMALIAEPSNRLVCLESLGFFHIKIVGSRKSVHMGVAQKSNNALFDIINVIDCFTDILRRVCVELEVEEEFEKIIYNWGSINGGQDPSIPIGHLELDGVIFLSEKIHAIKFQNVIFTEISALTGGSVKAEFGSFKFEGALSNSSCLSKMLLRKDFFPKGYSTSSGLFPSPCDARLFKHFSIPVTIYGPGSLVNAHSVDEYIDLEEIKKYLEHCLNAIFEILHD